MATATWPTFTTTSRFNSFHSTLAAYSTVGSICCGIHNKSTQKQFTATTTLTENLVQQEQVNGSEQLVLRLTIFPSEAVQIVYSRPQSHTSILCIHLFFFFLKERSLPQIFAFLSQGPFKNYHTMSITSIRVAHY